VAPIHALGPDAEGIGSTQPPFISIDRERMPSGTAPAPRHRAPFWLLGLLGFAPLYMAWLATYPQPTSGHRILEIGYLTLLQGATAWTLWKASARPDLPEGYREATRWLALALVMSFAAGLLFPFTTTLPGQLANLGLVDIFYLSAYPLTFLGLYRLPKASPPLPGFWRVILDSAAFVVGVGAPIWVFVVQPTLHRSLNLASILSAAYPLMAFLGVMVLNKVLLQSVPFPSRLGMNLLLAGLGISWLVDLVFAMEIAQAMQSGIRYWVNIGNALSLLLCLAGSWRIRTDTAPAQPLRPATVSPVPLLTILFVSIGLAYLLLHGSVDAATAQKMLVGILLLIVVLLFRESLALRETARLAAEAATAQVQSRFGALVRHSSDLVLLLDPQGTVSFASPAAIKVLGLAPEQLTGQRLTGLLHPDDAATAATFLQALLRQSEPLLHQCRLRHTDGSWRILEISGSDHLADPAVQGLVLNARDITERHRLEDQLREAQKMEAVGRLAGGIAHDFNNLLSAILGNAELAESHLPEGHPAAKDLRRVYGAATRGAVLTSRLLSFCRQDSPQSTTIDPGELISGVAPLLEGLLGEQVRLVLDLDPQAWSITMDPNELEQALLNLAANSRDAMPEGGKLTLRLHNQRLQETIITPYLPIASGESVILDVTDSGTGMDEATLQHLFEPFFTTKLRGKGTGLGLASVYGLLKSAQGGIDVWSKPGDGTTIRLVFPRSTAPVEAPAAPSGPEALRGSETILLVEDEPAVRQSIQGSLMANGYKVLAAQDADEARWIFRGNPAAIDLLLTDVIMPGDSGPVLAADLVASHPSLRVLYMSGYTANELGPHGLARPDAPLVRKPFTVAQLTHRLRGILAGPPGRV